MACRRASSVSSRRTARVRIDWANTAERARPACFGLVHGRVGVAQQVGGRHVGRVGEGDAGADGHEVVPAVEEERSGGLFSDPLADADRLGLAEEVFAEHDELVSAEAGDGVARSHRGGEPLGHQDQQPVALVVAEAVVDDLELVDVDEQDGQGAALAVEASQRQGEPVDQQDPVGQAGQRVVEGLVVELFFVADAVDGRSDDVGHRPQEAQVVGGERRVAGRLVWATRAPNGSWWTAMVAHSPCPWPTSRPKSWSQSSASSTTRRRRARAPTTSGNPPGLTGAGAVSASSSGVVAGEAQGAVAGAVFDQTGPIGVQRGGNQWPRPGRR